MDCFSSLPTEIVLRILRELSPLDIIICRQLSRHFYSLSKDQQLWEDWSSTRFSEEYIPPPTFSTSVLGSQVFESIAARCHVLANRAWRPSEHLQRQDPNMHRILLHGGSKKLWFLSGGEFLVVQFELPSNDFWMEIWHVPLLMQSKTLPRLIASTRVSRGVFAFTHNVQDSKDGVLLNIYTLICYGVEHFQIPLQSTNCGVVAPVSYTEVLSSPDMDGAKASSDGRFFWWPLRIYWGDEDDIPVIFALFDTKFGQTTHIRLTDLWSPEDQGFLQLEDIIKETLVVTRYNEIGTSISHILLYSLPSLDTSPSCVSYDDTFDLSDGRLSLPIASKFAFDLGETLEVSRFSSLGNNIISVGIVDTTTSIPAARFRLIKVLFPSRDAIPSNVAPQLVELGEFDVQKDEDMGFKHYRGNARLSSLFVAQSPHNGSHLRLVWLSYTNYAILCTVALDCEDNVKREGPISAILLNNSDFPRTIATDAFSGRCAYLVQGNDIRDGYREVKVFEGFGFT
ncbi:hypothetical protein DL96DRAFT_219033 [Flagelloscypha sp. PMI_526]|nr:hypothetical protein DL96DRAFT_219033 [Flagelloscypha sp. PMI_526]